MCVGTTWGLVEIDAVRLGLRVTLVRLFDLERLRRNCSLSDDWDDTEDALRCRCICVGSIFGILAVCANRERTKKRSFVYIGPIQKRWRTVDNGHNPRDIILTMH